MAGNSDKRESGKAVTMSIGFVRPIGNADAIAIGLTHPDNSQPVVVGLTRRDATMLALKLFDALRTDPARSNAERPFYSIGPDLQGGLALKKLAIRNEAGMAVLLLTTEEGLVVPFSFPPANVENIASMMSELALKIRGEKSPSLKDKH